MGDRKPFSFRFWQSASPPSSRTPAARTTTTRPAPRTSAARPATTTSATTPPPPTDGSQTSGQSNATTITPKSTTPPTAVTDNSATKSTTAATSTTPPAAEIETLTTKSTTTTTPPNPTPTPPSPTPTTQPEPKTQMAEQPPANAPTTTTPPPSDLQNAGQVTTTTARPNNGHQKKSPSRATTQSPSSSPSRSTTQSRSPPQPSSPSRAAPQARSAPSSPSRTGGSQSPSTPQRTSQLRSSSRLTTRSPKQPSSRSTNAIQSTLPSKESTQDISNSDKPPTFASNENELKPETSQQKPLEPQLEADGQTVSDKKIRENQMEVTSLKLSEISATTSPVKDPKTPAQGQTFVSSTINAEHNSHNESNKKPEETNKVKEVMQATNTEANTTIKRDENHLLTPKSGSEAQTTHAAEIPSKPDQIQMDKEQALDTKEISPASLPDIKSSNATVSKPRNSSVGSNTRAQSALPSGRHVPLSKDIRDEISKLINQTKAGDPKSIDERSVSVITLAGENRGASMQMGSNVSKTEGPIHIHRGYKIKRDEHAEVAIDGVESSKGNKSEDAKSPGDHERVSYINNNIQGINNSIVFNSSVAKRDPGVHMVIARVPNEPTETTDRRRPSETRKAEVSITRANKLTYEPKVRRRCIRDLYLEPSDSDLENPQMP